MPERTSVPWSVDMIECEESTEGWMVRRVQIDTSEGAVCGHACELKQKAAELMASASTRIGIPPEFEPFGQFMADGGAPVAAILRSFEKKASKEGFAITFNKDDVRGMYSASVTEKALDVQKMLEYLQHRVSTSALLTALTLSLYTTGTAPYLPTFLQYPST